MEDKADTLIYTLADVPMIASFGAIEIDNYLNGRGTGFTEVRELARILREYPVEEGFSYIPLWNAFKDKSTKKLETVSEIALETRLLVLELEGVLNNNGRLGELRSALCDVSREFLREAKNDYRAVA